MVEDRRLTLDNREAVATLATGMSKAFDSVCHGLLLANLRGYGFTDEASELMRNYLQNRRQRVKMDAVTLTGNLKLGPFRRPCWALCFLIFILMI